MNQWQFLTFGLGSMAFFLLPNLPQAKTSPKYRSSLIIHSTDTVWWCHGHFLFPREELESAGISIGDVLEVRKLPYDTDMELYSLYSDDKEVHRLESRIIGTLMRRGETLKAQVTDKRPKGGFRIDIILDRKIEPGERIRLFDNDDSISGVSVQLEKEGSVAISDLEGQYPVQALPWQNYRPESFQKDRPYCTSESNDKCNLREKGLTRMSSRFRRMTFPFSRWPDLFWAATMLQLGNNRAFFLDDTSFEISQLVLRGENLRGAIVRKGNDIPRQLFVDVELIA
jgi:hypothetical protein